MEFLYLLVAILIGYGYDRIMYSSVNTEYVPAVEMPTVVSDVRRAEERTANIIKERLCHIYHSDIDDKRDKIVRLLVQLEKLEDPDVFFDDHDHIRSYIFNTT